MDNLIPSLLLELWLKSVLNWMVVVIQRHYMIRSFSGFFCISLALIDTLLGCVLTAIFHLEDVNIAGWRLTGYHICLLTQITCFIYGVLHWPVFLLVGLDNIWTLSPNSAHKPWTKSLTYTVGVCLIWILAAVYVFWFLDVSLLVGDEKNHCRLFSSPQSAQLFNALVLTVTCIVLYSYSPCEKWRIQLFLYSTKGTQQTCSVCLRQIMFTFISTWASFLILMTILPLIPTEMHAHLQMNVVWLCFLNSFSVAMALCVHSFAWNAKNSDSITDGFCSWSFCFTYEAEGWNYGQQKDKTNGHIQVKHLNA
ncbi:probable G-protein coupled receptor 160 [Myxocyprinus asiaticus]|uniref:probable G-protein coupled receptor 160 n=1 Tax=Myxocyprinus asiaticus TaxID=70543 RepID=UPI002222F8F3|nr:probable G-protein coupled receptor 160 [Myxocyprinus asiaticus]